MTIQKFNLLLLPLIDSLEMQYQNLPGIWEYLILVIRVMHLPQYAFVPEENHLRTDGKVMNCIFMNHYDASHTTRSLLISAILKY